VDSSIVSMGGEVMVLGILKDIRSQLGKSPGDKVTVTVERDDAKRSVDIPRAAPAALTVGTICGT